MAPSYDQNTQLSKTLFSTQFFTYPSTWLFWLLFAVQQILPLNTINDDHVPFLNCSLNTLSAAAFPELNFQRLTFMPYNVISIF